MIIALLKYDLDFCNFEASPFKLVFEKIDIVTLHILKYSKK